MTNRGGLKFNPPDGRLPSHEGRCTADHRLEAPFEEPGLRTMAASRAVSRDWEFLGPGTVLTFELPRTGSLGASSEARPQPAAFQELQVDRDALAVEGVPSCISQAVRELRVAL